MWFLPGLFVRSKTAGTTDSRTANFHATQPSDRRSPSALCRTPVWLSSVRLCAAVNCMPGGFNSFSPHLRILFCIFYPPTIGHMGGRRPTIWPQKLTTKLAKVGGTFLIGLSRMNKKLWFIYSSTLKWLLCIANTKSFIYPFFDFHYLCLLKFLSKFWPKLLAKSRTCDLIKCVAKIFPSKFSVLIVNVLGYMNFKYYLFSFFQRRE